MSPEYTALFDASNGLLIFADRELKGVPGQLGNVDFKGKVNRLKLEEEKRKAAL